MKLRFILDDLDAEEKYSGVVLIAKEGEPVMERAFGYANLNYVVANQMDTKFNLGSMNKMFTAVAIVQLAEQGKLMWMTRLSLTCQIILTRKVAEIVTIHQLLTHTSGIGDFFSQEYRDSSNDLYKIA